MLHTGLSVNTGIYPDLEELIHLGELDGKEFVKRNSVKYGELVVLGYNGLFQQGEADERRSKFSLHKKYISNGVKLVGYHNVNKTQRSDMINNKKLYTVSYTISKNQAIVAQYDSDRNTDMFQIGRSSDALIDIKVADNVPGAKDTISRFACRIIVDRNPPYTARIYAAGFDVCSNIFLGENATKWYTDSIIDGLTTNGILIMQPLSSFSSSSQPGIWREISVNGGIYDLRESRSKTQKIDFVENENNILRDGALIDIFGAILLWRSADGLKKSLSCKELEHHVRQINASRPQCPVGLNTLVLHSKCPIDNADNQPYIYPNCGHIHGKLSWRGAKDVDYYICTICRTRGPFEKLQIGIETAFYVGNEDLTHCFSPCGHAASERTVKYWSAIRIHHGTYGLHTACPFCATPLEGDIGYVKLIYS